MERSNKHSPRIDDELVHETRSLVQGAPIESHVEEFKEQEGPGDDDRDTDVRPGAPGSLGADAVEARQELARHIRPSVFPADRDALLEEAREADAPAAVLAALEQVPAGIEYATLAEVWVAFTEPDVADDHDLLRERAAHEPLNDAAR